MFPSALVWSSIATALILPLPKPYIRFRTRALLRPIQLTSNGHSAKSSALSDSLRVLEWDKVCDSVASFAGTPLGREATKAQLWSLDLSYEESKNLLAETTAAIEMLNYGAGLDFSGIDVAPVKSAIDRASRGSPVDGIEAVAITSLLQFAEVLQITLKAAVKDDADWYKRFMPLTQVIMELIINRPFVKLVQKVIDEDGSVKDSASSELKHFRDKVRALEKKLYQLMEKLIRNDKDEATYLEVTVTNGRWCIKTVANQDSTFVGLLLPSGSGVESLVEPIPAVPLNDELQQARALVAKAEEDVLSRLTDEISAELDDIQNVLHTVIQLDVVTARAKYSLAYGGTFPELYLPEGSGGLLGADGHSSGNKKASVADGHSSGNKKASVSYHSQRKWKLYLRKAYHPLLLQQHRENLQKAKKDVTDATSEIRRAKFQGRSTTSEDNLEVHIEALKLKVSKIEQDCPIPVDFLVSMETSVLVITGPNTGGKTVSLKTIGLASLMAKSGLYVLGSEPVQIPWFDAIFADIGDEQSLAQSLSTFSGHLKQISAIQLQSTSKSLVLLDEVGAGTNPLEGAALGMSLLESFAENGALLTIATTHHGELKTLKYSNSSFENACVEFDEVSLKPAYKILWGVPGRSNGIIIAERLGLPHIVLDNARKLYGAASAEVNEVIIDMERFKRDFQKKLQEAQHYMMLSRKHHECLLAAKQKITEHSATQSKRKVRAVMDSAVIARSLIRNKLQQFRESATTQHTQNEMADNSACTVENLKEPSSDRNQKGSSGSSTTSQPSYQKQIRIPEVGDVVYVPSMGKKAIVLKVEASKGEILVQASNMKLRMKLNDIETQRVRTL